MSKAKVVVAMGKNEEFVKSMTSAGIITGSSDDLKGLSLDSVDLLPSQRALLEKIEAERQQRAKPDQTIPVIQEPVDLQQSPVSTLEAVSQFRIDAGLTPVLPQPSPATTTTPPAPDLSRFTFGRYALEFVQSQNELVSEGETGKCFAVLGEYGNQFLLQRLGTKEQTIVSKNTVREPGPGMMKEIEQIFGTRWPNSPNFIYHPYAKTLLSDLVLGHLLVTTQASSETSPFVSVFALEHPELGVFQIEFKKCRFFSSDVRSIVNAKRKGEIERIYLKIPITNAEWEILKLGTVKQKNGKDGSAISLVPRPGDLVSTREGDLGLFLVSWVSEYKFDSNDHIYMEGLPINFSEKDGFTFGKMTSPKVRTYNTDKKQNFYFCYHTYERVVAQALANPVIAEKAKQFKMTVGLSTAK